MMTFFHSLEVVMPLVKVLFISLSFLLYPLTLMKMRVSWSILGVGNQIQGRLVTLKAIRTWRTWCVADLT